MAFALLVDIIQMKASKVKAPPVELHEHYLPGEDKAVKDAI
jgi:hypothetical protein